MNSILKTSSGLRRAVVGGLVLFIGLASLGRLQAGLTVNINPGAGLSGNTPALNAFQAAANEWSSRISTNVVININADLLNLGSPSIIGSTSATFLQGPFNLIRNAMAAHAADGPNLGILAALPTAAQFSAFIPAGFALSPNIVLTQANAKALGFGGLVGVDATINFNSQFAFAYNSAQLNGTTVDFQTVAAHEIGHALGFISSVDVVDANPSGTFSPNPLDLFRFGAANIPTTVLEFTNNPRSFVPGNNEFLSDTVNTLRLSTGRNKGDGRQASHWKADELTGINLGIMDPTLENGVAFPVGENDLRALALIGYTVTAVPEPGSTALIVVGLSMLVVHYRVKSKRTQPKH